MTDPRQAVCPCCSFPTLTENDAFEICIICWWEDDGQSDLDADTARGGPNGRYSLADARRNFAVHGHMYDRGRGIQAVERPSVERRHLLDYLQSVGFDPECADAARLTDLLNAEDQCLRQKP
jgi:hypothetical protein